MVYNKLFRPAIDGQITAMAQIYASNFSCDFNHISAMVTELKKDFPNISDVDIQVQKYGRRLKGITFIEVHLPSTTKLPVGYEEIHQLEYIL